MSSARMAALRACTLGLGIAVAVVAPTGAATSEPSLELVGPGHARTLDLSLNNLAALPQFEIRTDNEFSDGVVVYRGPLVRDVLAALSLDRLQAVRFVAANDYYVDIPTSDFFDYDVILAMEADGKPLSRRDKGPLWLMYPISDHAALRQPVYLSRLIWQVVRIEAL